MTNFEKYKDEILEIIEYNTIAVDIKKNKPQSCHRTGCSRCIRYSDDGYCSFLNFFKWLYEEAKESLPTLTLKERGFCELVRSGYIARDSDTTLWVFTSEPSELDGVWGNEDDECAFNIIGGVFRFITYESGKAWSIEELLRLEVEE